MFIRKGEEYPNERLYAVKKSIRNMMHANNISHFRYFTLPAYSGLLYGQNEFYPIMYSFTIVYFTYDSTVDFIIK